MKYSALERLLKYIKIDTKSDEDSESFPSSENQKDLAEVLLDEAVKMGIDSAGIDEYSYVRFTLPASPGYEDAEPVGFFAHMDTSPDFSGRDVKAQIIEDYDGGKVALGKSGRVLDPAEFPHLELLKGRTLITTDGTTLLGADDKAGIAEIMAAAEYVMKENIPHGRIEVCFTPDEETGRGVDHFDPSGFGAGYAYTVDGGMEGEIEYENFNAYGAHVRISGKNIHPGSAKGKMINASLVGCEFISLLPATLVPSLTSGYEGFYHLTSIEGCCEKAELSFIIRDFDENGMKEKIKLLEHITGTLNEKYGCGTVELTTREQYRNMKEIIEKSMFLIDIARESIAEAGIKSVSNPVRGGTDGARLSFMGIPCPNLGTGGYCFHGPYEHISKEGMEKSVEVIIGIIKRFADMKY